MEALLTVTGSDYSRQMVTTRNDAAADEATWIRQAQQADARAFESLYRLHVDKVYGLCLRMTGNVSEAEDCTQEAFILAWDKLAKFRGDSAFSTWLHRIAVNSALQALRKADTRSRREAPTPEEIPVAPPSKDTLLRRRIENALDRLPEGMRQVLILHDVEGYTHEEIGDVLGVTSGTSKSQLFKARAKMRDMLSSLSGSVQEHGAEAWSI